MEQEQQQVEQQTQTQTVEQTHNIDVKQNEGGGYTAEVLPKDTTAPSQEEQQSPKEEGEQQTQNSSAPTTQQVQEEFDKQQQTETDLKQDLATKGVDFDALAQEYDRLGGLSQHSLDSLAKAGYPRSVVDAYLNGLQATTDRFVSTVKGFAGGEQAFSQLQSFMQTQPRTVIEAFNSVIEGGNLGQIQLAINGIKAQMTSKYGTANPTVMGKGSANNNPQGYTSMEQMTKDMSDPRYQVDPKFTREVMRKIKNATIF